MDVNQTKLVGYAQHSEHSLILWDKDYQLYCCHCFEPGYDFSHGCDNCGSNVGPSCRACGMDLGKPLDPFYFCEECNCRFTSYFIHKSCTEFPQEIQLSTIHQHSLHLVKESKFNYRGLSVCKICEKIQECFIFQCGKCRFRIDMGCALKFIKYHKDVEHAQHFSHQHLMAFFPELDDSVWTECKVCHLNIRDPSYGCVPCDFFLHKICFDKLKQEIQHSFHPLHTLKFLDFRNSDSWPKSECAACYQNCSSIAYSCDKCGFYLDIACAFLTPSIKYERHNHLLTLVKACDPHYQRECEACRSDILGDYFVRYVECNINYHINCYTRLQLPLTIEDKRHIHPITLTNAKKILLCDVCKNTSPQDSFYYCDECKFYFHNHCVITKVQLYEVEKVRHFSHEHDLIHCVRQWTIDNTFSCYACEKHVENTTSSYYCKICNVFLHDSCVSMEAEIFQHPLHPAHPLTLPTTFTATDRTCHACRKHFNGFAYQCQECNFDFDLECISKLDRHLIQIENHEHELTFFEKLYGNQRCVACKSTNWKTNYLRCLECDYNIHVMCSPLPETIEHVSHQEHPLSLKDYFFEDGSDEDHYCDYCEEIRDPQESGYCCEECHFVVDFEYIINQVLLIMKRWHTGTKFRPTDQIKRGLIVQQVMQLLSDEEKNQLKKIRDNAFIEIQKIFRHRVESSIIGSSDTDGELYYLAELKRNERGIRLDWDWDDVVVKVKDYKIPKGLAPILEKIMKIHGDFASECTLSPDLKMYFLGMFCGTVQSMFNTKVMNATEELLLRWLWSFKIGQSAGLKIQFAIDHWRNIRRVISGIYHDMIERNGYINTFVKRRIELSRKIDELTKQVEENDEEFQESLESTQSMTAREEKKVVYEVLELTMSTAGRGLLKMNNVKLQRRGLKYAKGNEDLRYAEAMKIAYTDKYNSLFGGYVENATPTSSKSEL